MGVPGFGPCVHVHLWKKIRDTNRHLPRPRLAKTFIPFFFHPVNIFEEPATRVSRTSINREEAITKQEKTQKQRPHGGGNDKTTVARNTRPKTLGSNG